MTRPDGRGYRVTVCASCLTAICWHGDCLCERASTSATTEFLASHLDAAGREHRSNYAPSRLYEITGNPYYTSGRWTP